MPRIPKDLEKIFNTTVITPYVITYLMRLQESAFLLSPQSHELLISSNFIRYVIICDVVTIVLNIFCLHKKGKSNCKKSKPKSIASEQNNILTNQKLQSIFICGFPFLINGRSYIQ